MSNKPLHTFIALRDGIKGSAQKELTAAHRDSVNAALYEGLTRRYAPKNEDGDQLPPENQNIQINAATMLNRLVQATSRNWDLMATIDTGNQSARADVEVPTGVGDETVTILWDVPATYLLYLARELDDIYTYVSRLPTLDPSVAWHYDENVAANVGEPTQTHRTKKVLRNHVKYPATDRHPAQVETFTEDEVVGYWTLVRRSGALPLQRKGELLQRVNTLRLAVKEARERANTTVVDDVRVAKPVYDYLLGELS